MRTPTNTFEMFRSLVSLTKKAKLLLWASRQGQSTSIWSPFSAWMGTTCFPGHGGFTNGAEHRKVRKNHLEQTRRASIKRRPVYRHEFAMNWDWGVCSAKAQIIVCSEDSTNFNAVQCHINLKPDTKQLHVLHFFCLVLLGHFQAEFQSE